MRRLAIGFVACVTAWNCNTTECTDEAASVRIALVGETTSAQSVEVRLAYDDVVRTFPTNLEGRDVGALRYGLVPPPKATTSLTVQVSMFAEPDARGPRVGFGERAVDVTPDGCNEFDLEVDARITPRDGGVVVARDGGSDSDPDGGRDGGMNIPRDGGPPDQGCSADVEPASLALFTFEQLPEILDDTGHTNSRYQPNQNEVPQGVDGPQGCGTALSLDGTGAVQVQGEALSAAEGSLEFWVFFDGNAPEGQGIISRDATGQADGGHFTVFRSCEERIVIRIQDLNQSVYRCSSEPVPSNTWVQVGINFGEPDLEMYLDGAIQNGIDQVPVYGADCATTTAVCGEPFVGGIDGNTLPMFIGASMHQALPDGSAGASYWFTGAIDSVHLRSTRRTF